MVFVSPRGVDGGTAVIVAPAKGLGHAHTMAIWSGRGNGLSLSALGGGEGRGEVGDSGPSPPPTSLSHAGACPRAALCGPVGRGPLRSTATDLPSPGFPAFAGMATESGKRVRPTETANNSKNSLLWLAVLRCYSASAVAEDPAFAWLRTIRWLLFLGMNSDISGPPSFDEKARRCYVAAILSGATRGVGPLDRTKARNSRAGKFASRSIAGRW